MAKQSMTKYQAEQVLGLSGSYDYATYTRAYRAAVKNNHPDVGGSQEKMIQINAAKEYLAGFFADDKTVTITCSTSEADFNDVADNNASAWTRVDNGSEKDAPFTTFDYTSKRQSQWDENDWNAFFNFQPTPSCDNPSYYVEKARMYDPNDPAMEGYVCEPDNISVDDWHYFDWCYYWFTNARHPRSDNCVYISRKPRPFYGPYAERWRAATQARYKTIRAKYQHPEDDEYVNTPYGKVAIKGNDGIDKTEWIGNVGVPFAYARIADYQVWLHMNIEAQKFAQQINGNKVLQFFTRTSGAVVAEGEGPCGYGWTGLEFLYPEDRRGDWIDILGLRGVVKGTDVYYNASVAAARKARSASATTSADASGKSKKERTGDRSAQQSARTAPGEARSAKRRKGVPAWVTMLSAFEEHFPWRITFWIVSFVWAQVLIAGGTTSGEQATLLVLVALTVVNVVFPILTPIRWVLRGIINIAHRICE